MDIGSREGNVQSYFRVPFLDRELNKIEIKRQHKQNNIKSK